MRRLPRSVLPRATGPSPRSPLVLTGALALALALPMAPAFAAGPADAAQAAEARGDLRAAQNEWRNLLRAEPNSAAAHLALARTSLEIGEIELAEREARAALQQGADQAQGSAVLLRTYLSSGRYEQLLKDFPELQTPPALAAQLAAARTQAQVGLGQKEAAAASAALAERLAPGSADALLAASSVALLNGDRAGGEAALDRVLAADANNLEALQRKGVLQAERRDTAGALASFGRIIEQAPGNVPARLRRAEVLVQSGQDARARTDLDAALLVLPGSVPGQFLNALLLARAEKWPDADAALQRLGPNVGNFPDGYLVQALVKRGLGQ